VKLPIS